MSLREGSGLSGLGREMAGWTVFAAETPENHKIAVITMKEGAAERIDQVEEVLSHIVHALVAVGNLAFRPPNKTA